MQILEHRRFGFDNARVPFARTIRRYAARSLLTLEAFAQTRLVRHVLVVSWFHIRPSRNVRRTWAGR
jgi:hypothetical protein